MQDDDFCLVSVATFDRLADRYAEKYFHSDAYDRYLEEFAERIRPQGARVLDAACTNNRGQTTVSLGISLVIFQRGFIQDGLSYNP